MFAILLAGLLLCLTNGDDKPTPPCNPESSTCRPHPSLAEVQKRAATWKQIKVEQLMDFPAVFVLRGFLKSKELKKLHRFATSSEQMKMGGNMAMVDSPNGLDIASGIDKRMATLAGLPISSVEEGHFNFYETASKISVHQDNNNPSNTSQRVASFVVYVEGEEQGLVGGHTVFPLLNFSNNSRVRLLSESQLAKWDKALNAAPLASDPKSLNGRFCMDSKPLENYKSSDLCKPLLRLTRRACSIQPASHGVMPKAGDAVMFYHLGMNSKLTNLAVHGSCGVSQGRKIMLAKFLTMPTLSEGKKGKKGSKRTDL